MNYIKFKVKKKDYIKTILLLHQLNKLIKYFNQYLIYMIYINNFLYLYYLEIIFNI